MVLLTGGSSGYAQFITVLLLFVVVLGITAAVTKWMANYQKQQSAKYIQIIRAGGRYMVIAVCKDTVTMLGEIPEGELKETKLVQGFNFKEILEKAAGKKDASREEPKDSQLHDEK